MFNFKLLTFLNVELWACLCACGPQSGMQVEDVIPRRWDPRSKGSRMDIWSERGGHNQGNCRRRWVVSPGWTQGQGLVIQRWSGNRGVVRNWRPCWTRKGSRETEASVARASWGRGRPGRHDRVRPVTLRDGHGGRSSIWSVSLSCRCRRAGGNNELWRRGRRRYREGGGGRERWGGPTCICSHQKRTTATIQTVNSIDEMTIGNMYPARISLKKKLKKNWQ